MNGCFLTSNLSSIMNTVNVNLGTFKARIFVFIDFKERGAFEKKKELVWQSLRNQQFVANNWFSFYQKTMSISQVFYYSFVVYPYFLSPECLHNFIWYFHVCVRLPETRHAGSFTAGICCVFFLFSKKNSTLTQWNWEWVIHYDSYEPCQLSLRFEEWKNENLLS